MLPKITKRLQSSYQNYNMKVRDLSIDYAKGIAILLVYMGHSILYYPPGLFADCHWSRVLGQMIVSFNMPLFFFLSGLLFAYSKKSNMEVIRDKVRRLMIPYLFTMLLVVFAKQFVPSDMSANAGGGGIFWLTNVFVYGGERWFVYVLMWIFLLSLPLRRITSRKGIWIAVAISFGVTMAFALPEVFKIDMVVWYISFFLIGMHLNQHYMELRQWNTKYAIAVLLAFVIMNIFFVCTLMTITPLKIMVLPLTGTIGVMTLSWLLDDWCKKRGKENVIAKYIAYCGKYSLQFYLFTFAYPIIRYVVVNVLHVTSPLPVFFLVFVSQLIVMTTIVEVTRRIKILKIPMGY